MKCTYSKAKKATSPAKSGAPIASFTLTDDPGKPGNYIVNGTNAAGDLIDISAVATISVASDDTTLATVSPTGANKFAVQGLKATLPTTPVMVTIVATWNDGSVGPFSADVAFSVTPGATTGLVVTPV